MDELKKTSSDEKRDALQRELDELREKIRKDHHKISRWFVENDSRLKSILEKHGFAMYWGVLARIIEGHRMDIAEIFKLKTVGNVRTSLLAFLLQIADDMDIGFRRVDSSLVESMHHLSAESVKHILANLRVKGKRVGGEVIYYVGFEDVEVERSVLELLVDWNGKIERRI